LQNKVYEMEEWIHYFCREKVGERE
jgi:hypothetical protein